MDLEKINGRFVLRDGYASWVGATTAKVLISAASNARHVLHLLVISSDEPGSFTVLEYATTKIPRMWFPDDGGVALDQMWLKFGSNASIAITGAGTTTGSWSAFYMWHSERLGLQGT